MENQIYFCPKCGNKNPLYFGVRAGKLYCRKCLTFRGNSAPDFVPRNRDGSIYLSYDLSKEQQELSNGLIDNYSNGINSLVHAVCGAGKTEIVLGVISYAIKKGQSVGFAVPRRDVIIELSERFQSIFLHNKISTVYGGHTSELDGDIVCLTTHQLYRYENYFDLLIIDEIDAFPFRNNDTLDAFFQKSVKGNYILMSATADEKFTKEFIDNGGKVLELFVRFHRHPLPVPKIVIRRTGILFIELCRFLDRFLKEKKPIFIFTPTIEMCETTYRFLSLIFSKGNYVHSKCDNRSQRIQDFRDGKYRYLVTTAVLERGVTVKNLQVIIYHAEHDIYDSAALTQIAGRAGRKKDYPEGEVIFLAKQKTQAMEDSIREIERANANLQNMLQTN